MLYLSIPYTSPDPDVRSARVAAAREVMAGLVGEGRVTVCPVTMNHEAIEAVGPERSPGGAYWRELETRLADVCDELVVVTAPGWRESRGVAREIALFEANGKPVRLVPPPQGVGVAGAPSAAEPT